MNPAKDVDYPDPINIPEEPTEPGLEDDPEQEIPVEHALDIEAHALIGSPMVVVHSGVEPVRLPAHQGRGQDR